MIKVPAVIDKEDIAVLGALKGMSNRAGFSAGDVIFKQNCAVFRGFAGRLHIDDRRYHGVVMFEQGPVTGSTMTDFEPIVQAMDTSEREVTDVVHSDDNGND